MQDRCVMCPKIALHRRNGRPCNLYNAEEWNSSVSTTNAHNFHSSSPGVETNIWSSTFHSQPKNFRARLKLSCSLSIDGKHSLFKIKIDNFQFLTLHVRLKVSEMHAWRLRNPIRSWRRGFSGTFCLKTADLLHSRCQVKRSQESPNYLALSFSWFCMRVFHLLVNLGRKLS